MNLLDLVISPAYAQAAAPRQPAAGMSPLLFPIAADRASCTS